MKPTARSPLRPKKKGHEGRDYHPRGHQPCHTGLLLLNPPESRDVCRDRIGHRDLRVRFRKGLFLRGRVLSTDDSMVEQYGVVFQGDQTVVVQMGHDTIYASDHAFLQNTFDSLPAFDIIPTLSMVIVLA